jgi:hypothetical protein
MGLRSSTIFIEHDSAATYITGLNIMSQPQNFANTASVNEHDTLWTADSFLSERPDTCKYRLCSTAGFDGIVFRALIIPVNLTIPYDQNFIQFQFAKVHQSRQEAILYSYILQGIDKNWSSFTTNPFTDNYLNLPPGQLYF